MSKIIQINNMDLVVKEFNGQRVVTFRDIDNLHKRAEGTASRNFRTNKDKFINNVDYFDLTYEQVRATNFVDRPNSQGLMLITESGYLMLVKSLTDDLAWEVQRELVNNYFRGKEVITSLNGLSPELQMFGQMFQAVANIEIKQNQLEDQVTTIKDTIVLRDTDWRKDVNFKLRKIGTIRGDYREIVKESYRLLEGRARCDLSRRLTNMRQRMAAEGATKTAIGNTNYLDVLEVDEKLKEIYINIVNQLYIQYAA